MVILAVLPDLPNVRFPMDELILDEVSVIPLEKLPLDDWIIKVPLPVYELEGNDKISFSKIRIPLLIVVTPVYVFVPDNVKVPAPALVNTAASPSFAITPVISEDVPVLVILIVPPTVKAAALKSLVEMVNPFNPPVPPTAPVNEISPVPFVVIVRVRSVASLSVVSAKETEPLDVVVKVLFALNVTAPSYVCDPDVVTSAPRLEVPETLIEVAPALLSDVFIILPSRFKLPVMMIAPTFVVSPTVLLKSTVASELKSSVPLVSTVKSWGPLTVPVKVTVYPEVVKVLAAPDNVTLPVYS